MIPCPPPVAYETRLIYTDVRTKSQEQTLENVKKMTQIRENAPAYEYDEESICTSCSKSCFQCSGTGFNIRCSACRNVCPPRRFRSNMARPLTHVDERQGRWMPAYYQADELPYNVPGPRGGRHFRVAGHFLTGKNAHRNIVFWNQCVQAEIEKNISMELDRIYQRDRTVASDLRKVTFILGLVQQWRNDGCLPF